MLVCNSSSYSYIRFCTRVLKLAIIFPIERHFQALALVPLANSICFEQGKLRRKCKKRKRHFFSHQLLRQEKGKDQISISTPHCCTPGSFSFLNVFLFPSNKDQIIFYKTGNFPFREGERPSKTPLLHFLASGRTTGLCLERFLAEVEAMQREGGFH